MTWYQMASLAQSGCGRWGRWLGRVGTRLDVALEVLRLGTQKCIGGLHGRMKRGGPPVEKIRAAFGREGLRVSIIKDDPHAFDIISEGLGRDLKLLVAEGLQIAPVGWVVSEGNADDRTITCFGLFGIQQGVSAQGDDCVLPPMPVGCSQDVEDRAAILRRCGQICTGACCP